MGNGDQHHRDVGCSAAPPRIPSRPGPGSLLCFSPGCAYQQLRSAFAALVTVSFHVYFLKPPAQGGKDTRWKMNSFPLGEPWGIILGHPSPGTAPSRGSGDLRGRTAAPARPPSPLARVAFANIPKMLFQIFPGLAVGKNFLHCCRAVFAAGKSKSGWLRCHQMWHQ